MLMGNMEANTSARVVPKTESHAAKVPKTEVPESESLKKEKLVTEVKNDPDTPPPATTTASSRIKAKDEEPEFVKIDRSIPEIEGEEDMFEDVDGDEIVDLTYEGIAHVNGVRHFVCEGLLTRRYAAL